MDKIHILRQERKKIPKWIRGLGILFLIDFLLFIFLPQHLDGNMADYVAIILFACAVLIATPYFIYAAKQIYLGDFYALRIYRSELSLKLCRDYIRLNNINDILKYEIVELEKNRFRIRFPRQTAHGNAYASQGTFGTVYQLNMYEKENGTEITCIFLKGPGSKRPLRPWYLDKLLEMKCDAVHKEFQYRMEVEDW